MTTIQKTSDRDGCQSANLKCNGLWAANGIRTTTLMILHEKICANSARETLNVISTPGLQSRLCLCFQESKGDEKMAITPSSLARRIVL